MSISVMSIKFIKFSVTGLLPVGNQQLIIIIIQVFHDFYPNI